jgi:hypothetical protein
MNLLLKRLMFPYMAPAGAAAATGGSAQDRGDGFIPSNDEDAADEKKEVVAETETEEERAEREKEEKAAAEEAEKIKRIRIPKSRVDEMVAKERAKVDAIQKELDKALAAVQHKEVSADVRVIQDRIDVLEEEIEGFRADGKKAELAAARRELRELTDVLIEHRITERAAAAKEMAKTELKYDALVEQIEKEYPELNPDSDDYDDDKAEEILELRDGFTRNGMAPYDALKRAMKYVVGDKRAEKTAARADDRAEKAREKAANASRQQPSSLRGAGFDSDKAGGAPGEAKNVMKMNQTEFSKLTDDQRRAMRGDET